MHATALLVLLASIGSAALGQEIGFKGFPLGASKAELLEKFQALECKPPLGRSFAALGEEICTPKMWASSNSARPFYSYGGQPAADASFGIVNGRAEQFSMTFSPDKYEAIKSALIEAYGPGQESTSARRTLAGVALESRQFTISRPSGMLTLVEHAGRIDQGAIDGRTPNFSAYVEQVKRGDSKVGRRDL